MKRTADPKDPGRVRVAENRRARHDYAIGRTLECGIELRGAEVKALRAGRVSISDAYGVLKAGELHLVNLKIHRLANQHAHTTPAEGRTRRLLAHRREIDALAALVADKGHSLVPLQIYFSGSWAKVLLGVGAGKTHADKRADTMKREADREMARAITRHGRQR